jgi:hypothetical protein
LQLIGGYPGLEEEAIKLKYSHSEVRLAFSAILAVMKSFLFQFVCLIIVQLESVSAMASPRKIPEKFLKDIKQ